MKIGRLIFFSIFRNSPFFVPWKNVTEKVTSFGLGPSISQSLQPFTGRLVFSIFLSSPRSARTLLQLGQDGKCESRSTHRPRTLRGSTTLNTVDARVTFFTFPRYVFRPVEEAIALVHQFLRQGSVNEQVIQVAEDMPINFGWKPRLEFHIKLMLGLLVTYQKYGGLRCSSSC